jgi:hypothetical protein
MNGADFGLSSIFVLALAGLIAIPLAIWKVIDLLILLFSHIHWN